MEDRDEEFEKKLDDELVVVPQSNEDKLNLATKDIVNEAIVETDDEKLKRMVSVFNQHIMKKRMLRSLKVSDGLERATDEVVNRVTNAPNHISDKDLAKYMELLHKMENGYQESIDGISEKPIININPQTNNVIVPSVSDESSKRILEAVALAMEIATQPQTQEVEEVEIVDEEEE